MIFWRNGFTLQEGPLRSYEEPFNQRLLQQIQAGQAPVDELGVLPGQPVEMRVSHRLQEDWRETTSSGIKPFQGTANRISDNPQVPVASPVTPTSILTASTFDPSAPATTLQIRLANGQRYDRKCIY